MTANVWINEINYSEESAVHDEKDFIELAGTAGTDLSGWTIYECFGSNVVPFVTIDAGTTISAQSNGFGTLKVTVGLPDGDTTSQQDIALVVADAQGNFVTAVVYGTDPATVTSNFILPDGVPGAGTKLSVVKVMDQDFDHDYSIQLTGSGHRYTDFTWAYGADSGGGLNTGESFTANAAPELFGTLSHEMAEKGTFTIAAAELFANDDDNTPDQIVFTVSDMSHGTIKVHGVEATTFTAQDISDGAVTFTHDGNLSTSAGFKVSVDDFDEDGSTPDVADFTITVDQSNDPAVFSGDLTGAVTEHLDLTAKGQVSVADPDGSDTFSAAKGKYGAFVLNASTGRWSYTLDDGNKTVAALDTGETLVDHIKLRAADGTTSEVAITISGVTDIIGTNGNDHGAFSDLRGSAVREFIHGLKGNDRAYGLGGDDFLFGDAGNDILYGDDVKASKRDGSDVLDGGAGADKLWGGGGADRFVFGDGDSGLAAGKRDVIQDFSHKDGDVIDLSDIDANGKSPRDDVFKGYDSEKQALAHVGALFIDRHGGDITIYMNTEAKQGFEMAITLDGVKTLAADDFVL